MLVSGISIALMRGIDHPIEAILLYGLLFALASAGTSITPIGVIVSRWFPERTGLANSIAISGMGVGQLLIILVLTRQLELVGWRDSFLFLGIAGLALVAPLLMLAIVPAARLHGRTVSHGAGAVTQADGKTPVKSRYFWLLLAIYAICGFQDFFVATHVVAFARDEGIDTLLAGNLYAFMGLMGLAGVLITGYLSDRVGPVGPTAACFVLRIVIFTMILVVPHPLTIAAFALLYGFTFWITAPLTVVFVRQRFGHANLGTVTGIVTMVHHGAGGLGAFAGGYIFDASGDYVPVFQLMLVVSVIALWLTARLGLRSSAAV